MQQRDFYANFSQWVVREAKLQIECCKRLLKQMMKVIKCQRNFERYIKNRDQTGGDRPKRGV